MRFVTFLDDGVLGLRHEGIALLPRHGGEAAAFFPANLVEDGLGELAFRCSACGFGPNSSCRRLGNLRCLGSLDRRRGRMLGVAFRPTNPFCFLSHLLFPPWNSRTIR